MIQIACRLLRRLAPPCPPPPLTPLALAALLIVLSFCNPSASLGQGLETAEGRAFNLAMSAFIDRLYERAERGFAQFIATFPQSPLVAEATLLQAEAALNQTNAT